jgi:hypothetical protein
MSIMQIAAGRVVNGQVVVEAELPEGAEVTLLALDGEETFEVDDELAAVLVESIAQGDRGETIPAEELLRELRIRERANRQSFAPIPRPIPELEHAV